MLEVVIDVLEVDAAFVSLGCTAIPHLNVVYVDFPNIILESVLVKVLEWLDSALDNDISTK